MSDVETNLRKRFSRAKVAALVPTLSADYPAFLSPFGQPIRIHMNHSLDPFVRLMETLAERQLSRPPGSYTTKLLEGGAEKIGGKILEEAQELIEAAGESGEQGRKHFVYEAGDLIYHTLVLLAWKGVDIAEVATELARREGTSGLVEKASRTQPEQNQ